MLKAYKYRLYPTEEQKIQLSKTFGCVRFVYNYYLEKKMELYKTEKRSMSKSDCNNHCNQQLKNEFVWLREVDKFALIRFCIKHLVLLSTGTQLCCGGKSTI